LASATPRFAPDGLMDGAILMFVDITDRKRFEQALRISEERRQLALEGGELGLWDWDSTYR
jgi:PAS domain-containing protein